MILLVTIPCLAVGSQEAGKTCLLKRYCEGRVCDDDDNGLMLQFVSKYICTIGVDYGVKTVVIDDKNIKVCRW